jgi:hypothetical protein
MEFHTQELSLTVKLHIQSYIPQVNSSNLCNIIDNPETFSCFFNRTTVNIHLIYINNAITFPVLTLIHSPFVVIILSYSKRRNFCGLISIVV